MDQGNIDKQIKPITCKNWKCHCISNGHSGFIMVYSPLSTMATMVTKEQCKILLNPIYS